MSQLFFKNSNYVKELSPQDFKSIATWKLKDNKCSIVLFYVDWCKFCQAAKDPYETFAKSALFMDVYAFNCEYYKDHLLKIKEDMPNLIKAYPTIIFYKKGEPVEAFMDERTPDKFLKSAMRVCQGKK